MLQTNFKPDRVGGVWGGKGGTKWEYVVDPTSKQAQ